MTGDDLKLTIHKLRVTKQEFADAAGVSRQTISNWEKLPMLDKSITLQVDNAKKLLENAKNIDTDEQDDIRTLALKMADKLAKVDKIEQSLLKHKDSTIKSTHDIAQDLSNLRDEVRTIAKRLNDMEKAQRQLLK